jgi:hypothetical protein
MRTWVLARLAGKRLLAKEVEEMLALKHGRHLLTRWKSQTMDSSCMPSENCSSFLGLTATSSRRLLLACGSATVRLV